MFIEHTFEDIVTDRTVFCEIKVIFEGGLEDHGIGSYECHGQRGNHVDLQWCVNKLTVIGLKWMNNLYESCESPTNVWNHGDAITPLVTQKILDAETYISEEGENVLCSIGALHDEEEKENYDEDEMDYREEDHRDP